MSACMFTYYSGEVCRLPSGHDGGKHEPIDIFPTPDTHTICGEKFSDLRGACVKAKGHKYEHETIDGLGFRQL